MRRVSHATDLSLVNMELFRASHILHEYNMMLTFTGSRATGNRLICGMLLQVSGAPFRDILIKITTVLLSGAPVISTDSKA